jgi:acetyltransferase
MSAPDEQREASGPHSAANRAPAREAPLAHDVFRQEARPLDAFFRPRTVAVVGATETPGSVGRTLLWNLLSSPFGGTIFPVNPKRENVLGVKAYRTVADVPAAIDLAVVVTPAAAVPTVIGQCADRGVPAAVVISAGFRETGAAGAALEARVLAEARRGGMRVVGPNCLGVMSPPSGLNATFAAGMARPGSVAFLSQSGALLTAILDWSLREQVGFSAFVSLGSMLDVGWGDLIDHLGNDPRTRAIVIYMESVGDARAFLSAAREVAMTKPIIVIKAGRSQAASRAAASHTGALTGSDEVLDAAFRRIGVLRVNEIGDVFDMADVLGKQPRPAGPRLTIVTNAGGPGVLATDALVAGGGDLATLSDDTVAELGKTLPAAWSRANPIDVLGDADPARYTRALELAAADTASDGLLVVLTPQDMTDPTLTAEAVRKHAHIPGKPVLASWMGGAQVAAGIDILNRAGIPTFEFPDDAARAFCAMWRYEYNLRGLYETVVRRPEDDARPDEARRLIGDARGSGRTLLDEHESKAVLASYGIPVVPTRAARDQDEAVTAARALGFPVAVKLRSHTITHKTDVGGVKLGLGDADAVARAFREIEAAVAAHAGPEHFQGVTVQPMIDRRAGYEVILGSAPDAQFGPVLLFGAGGELVEVFRDRALALPPLNRTLARRMMEQTRIFRALKGVRGRPPADLEALESLLVRFGDLVLEQRWIREIDVNPLLVTPDGALALDARVVLHDAAADEATLPRPAIRPYPTEYVWRTKQPDGEPLLVRPIRPDDEAPMVAFHRTLSDESVRARYMHTMKLDDRTAHERLVRICFVDYDRELALVVERPGPRDPGGGSAGASPTVIMAVGRLSHDRVAARDGRRAAEFSLLVGDPWQGRGLGRELLGRLIQMARQERLSSIYADILQANVRMQRLCAHFGFRLAAADGGVMHAELPL